MSIFTDADIELEILSGNLVHGRGGLPDPGLTRNIEACSFDMTVGSVYDDGHPVDYKVVPPGGIVALHTEEELDLPNDVCATAFAINAASSTGFLVLNPGHIDPGYKGPLTVFAVNIGSTSNRISKRRKVFTLVFERLPKPVARGYRDRYSLPVNREDHEARFMEKLTMTKPVSLAGLMENELLERLERRVGYQYATKEEVAKATSTKWGSIAGIAFVVVAAILSLLSTINSADKAEKAAAKASQALEESKMRGVQVPIWVPAPGPAVVPATPTPTVKSN